MLVAVVALVAFVAFVAFVTKVAPITDTTCAAVAAVMADAPLPKTKPESVVAPVPPEATAKAVLRPEIVPPVMATALAFCVDIVPKPVMSVLGIVAEAVMALVPAPLT